MKLSLHAKILGLGLMATALTACSSGGNVSTLLPASDGSTTPTERDTIRPTGQTIAQRIEAGAIAQASSKDSTAIKLNSKNATTQAVSPSKFQVRNNYIGGLDVSVEGDIVSLTQSDANSDLTSWGKNTNGYSLALWNAGRGGREGLFRDEDGQKYHKIIGYRHEDKRSKELTLGHSIIGVKTSTAAMEELPRTLEYDGYFVASAVPVASQRETDAINLLGGLRIEADFERQTVTGRSLSFEVQEPSDLGAIASGNRMRFEGIVSGSSYTGNVASSHGLLNGAAIAGQFYGASAQETAGIIRGENSVGAVQGYFTASDPTQ